MSNLTLIRSFNISHTQKISNKLTIFTQTPVDLNVGDVFTIRGAINNPISNQQLTVLEALSPTSFTVQTEYNLTDATGSSVEITYYTDTSIGKQRPIPFLTGDVTYTLVGTGDCSFVVGSSQDGATAVDAAAIQLSNVTPTETLNISSTWKYMHINILSISANCKLYISWVGR